MPWEKKYGGGLKRYIGRGVRSSHSGIYENARVSNRAVENDAGESGVLGVNDKGKKGIDLCTE